MAKQKTNTTPPVKAVTLEWVPFEKLVFLENNPRTRTEEGKRKMAADIEADPSFYENRPTLVNLTEGRYHVYAGDLRAHAAHEVLNWSLIPCNVEADVPPELMRRRAILDNTHREDWDADKLSEWGYEPEELEEMGVWLVDGEDESEGGVPNNALNSEAVEEDDFEAPEIETVQTDIVLGDLFEIGPHRLLCEDSAKAENVERVMGGKSTSVVIADPPYGIALRYVGVMANNSNGNILGDDTPFDPKCLELWGCSVMYVFGADYFIEKLPSRKGLCVWAKAHTEKENLVFGASFETFWRSHRDKREIWFERRINALPENEHEHPTQKPICLIARCISDSDKPGIVADPFLGSGTTMVAAHQLNRVCYGLELEPKYCDVIVRRMLKLDNALTVKRNGVDETGKWLKFVTNS